MKLTKSEFRFLKKQQHINKHNRSGDWSNQSTVLESYQRDWILNNSANNSLKISSPRKPQRIVVPAVWSDNQPSFLSFVQSYFL
jgi:hypothetical protein